MCRAQVQLSGSLNGRSHDKALSIVKQLTDDSGNCVSQGVHPNSLDARTAKMRIR
jgi:hypothetical protein